MLRVSQLAGFGGIAGAIQFPTGASTGSTSNSDLSNKTVAFATDGSLTYTAGGASALSPAGWFLPPAAGIGSSYWVRANSITLSGTTTNRATVGPAGWVSISTAPAYGLRATSTGTSGTTTATVNYSIASDVAGTNVLGTASFTVVITYA